jgi:hypothetical protein
LLQLFWLPFCVLCVQLCGLLYVQLYVQLCEY